MGYSATKAQGLAAPPHLFAFVVVLLTSVVSDRLQSRSIPIIIHASFALLGYMLLALAPTLHLSSTAQYLCIYPITAGFFSAVTTVIVWTVNNQQSEEGRGSNVALLNVIGQLGPLVSQVPLPKPRNHSFDSRLYRWAYDFTLTLISRIIPKGMLCAPASWRWWCSWLQC